MDEHGDTNNVANASGRNSSGGGSNSDDNVRELVDFHAFLLGLIGNGAGSGDAHPNETDDVGDHGATTPAEQGRSIRATTEGNPEMQQLMEIVVGTLNRSLKPVTYFRQLVRRATKDEQGLSVTHRVDPLIQAVVESGAVRDLVEIMGGHNSEDSDEAAWALVHLVNAGTKLHIQQAIDEGVLPKFAALLVSPSVELRREAARVLGNMANLSQGGRFRWREPLWASGAIDALMNSLQQDDDADVLQYAADAIGNVFESEPDDERVSSVAPTLAQLLFYHDEKVLENACWAFTGFLTVDDEVPAERVQTIIRMGVCRRLVELLQHPNHKMHFPALAAILSILAGDEEPQKKSILTHRPLPALRDLMVNGETFLVATACEALAIILALGRGHIEAAIQHDIVPVLVELLVVGNLDLFIPALKAIHAATSNGTRDQIRVLTGTGCIERLCDYLDSYPDDDDPIVEILEVLANMLRAGADRRGANPMAAEVLEHGGFDLLQELRRHDNPEIRAGAVALLQTYFDEEQDESEAESDSDASGEADEDEDEDDGEDGSGR